MFKSVALKFSAAVLAILSICFSGVVNDALKVDAAADDFSSNPYNMGMFDTVEVSEQKIRRQTGYVNIPDVRYSDITYLGMASDYHMWVLDNSAFTNAYRDSASNYHGYGYCNSFRFSQASSLPGDFVRPLDYCSFSSQPAQYSRLVFFVYSGNLDSTNKGDLANYLPDGVFLQYKTITSTLSDFVDDINGENAASAWLDGYDAGDEAGESRGYGVGFSSGYSDGYSDGRNAAIDIEQSITVRIPDNTYGFHVKVTLGNGSVIEQDLNHYAPYVSFKRSVSSVAKIELSDSYSDEEPYFNVSVVYGITTYSGIYNALVVGGAVYLPTWENPVEVVVRTTGAPDFSDVNDLRFDPDNVNNVFIGSDAYSQGYDAGKDYGEDQGYMSGYSDGRSEGYSYGYASGYSEGNVNGYNSGYNAGGGNMQVIDIWPLMSAVITMPFTFFSQGLDWTLFEGSPYEFSVSIFFGSVLVILMLWKIIQLVIGLGK